jgi:hypothetical protein
MNNEHQGALHTSGSLLKQRDISSEAFGMNYVIDI